MSKNSMFKNVGKEIEKIAENHATTQLIMWAVISGAVFIISIILSVVLENIVFFLIGLLLTPLMFYVGYTIAKLSAIRLYAYGQLVDDMHKIIKYLNIDDTQEETPPPEENKTNVAVDGIISQDIEHDHWSCPECCRVVPNNTKVCRCGHTKEE